jgi:MFS family permease
LSQDKDAQRQVEKDLPWNFTVNLLDVSFYTIGVNLVARQTILPLLVSQLTASRLAIGLIPAIDSLGFLLPQLFTANYSEGLRRKLPFITPIAFWGERLPYLLIGLTVWWLAVPAPALTLAAFFALLGAATFSGGFTMPAWYDLIAKVIPANKRGIWSGLSYGGGALLGVAGAALAGRILVEWAYPRNFAICFFLCFAALMVSWLGLVLNREPDSLSIKTGTPLIAYLKQLPSVLRRDSNYLHFLITRAVASLGTMAAGFYIVYGSERWGISGGEVGVLTAILTGSQAIMNVLWGLAGDCRGHKLVLCAGYLTVAAAAIVASAASSVQWLWLTFAFLGAATAANNVSSVNIILEFCAPEDRPTYIGLTNTILTPVAVFAPLLGGALATLAGYRGMFVVAAAGGLLSAVLMAVWVREPRRLRTGTAAS